MRGLLYKDFINIRQLGKIYLLILCLWAGIAIVENNISFFGGVMSVFSVLIPLTASSYDEKTQWDKYALTMPVTRRELVFSKYLLGLSTLLGCFILTVAVSAFTKTSMAERADMFCVFGALGMACMAVMLPVSFQFGVEKARNAMFLLFLVPAALGLLAEQFPALAPDEAAAERLFHLAPGAAAALLLLSLPVSVLLYERREF